MAQKLTGDVSSRTKVVKKHRTEHRRSDRVNVHRHLSIRARNLIKLFLHNTKSVFFISRTKVSIVEDNRRSRNVWADVAVMSERCTVRIIFTRLQQKRYPGDCEGTCHKQTRYGDRPRGCDLHCFHSRRGEKVQDRQPPHEQRIGSRSLFFSFLLFCVFFSDFKCEATYS